MKTGIELITDERKDQIEKHGFNAQHDCDHHCNNVLSWHAAVLASPNVLYIKRDYANVISFEKADIDVDWKLPNLNYAPHRSNVMIDNEGLPKSDRLKQLIVAGALIAAEIDRLQMIK